MGMARHLAWKSLIVRHREVCAAGLEVSDFGRGLGLVFFFWIVYRYYGSNRVTCDMQIHYHNFVASVQSFTFI